MANATLQGNVAQEMARRRVTDELMPKQDYWRDQLGIPEPQLPSEPYTTFDAPMVSPQFMQPESVGGMGDVGVSAAQGSTGPSTSNGTIGFGQAFADAFSANPMMAAVPFGTLALAAIAANNMDAPDSSTAVDAGSVGSADASAGIGDSSATSVDGISASDAAAMGDAFSFSGDGGDGGGGGGGGGGGKIVCTAMNQAYGFGSFRQAIWLEYSAKRLTKQHERGYHRIFKPLVKYAFHSGNGNTKQTVRRFLEWVMRLRTADLRAEMRGRNPHPVRRIIRRASEHICYMVGKS